MTRVRIPDGALLTRRLLAVFPCDEENSPQMSQGKLVTLNEHPAAVYRFRICPGYPIRRINWTNV